MEKIDVIVNTDPGIDDAVAIKILLQSGRFNVLLFATSGANVPAELGARNCNFLVHRYGNGETVAIGAQTPLSKELVTAENIHGEGGLGSFKVPKKFDCKNKNAIELMYEKIMQNTKKVSIISLGAFTNIAILFKKHPDVISKIEKIYAMIGSMNGEGNITKFAEFNSYCDPDAFFEVLKSNIPIVFNPKEIGEKAMIYNEEVMCRCGDGFDNTMFEILRDAREMRNDCECFYVYDAHTILSIIKPELYKIFNVDVSLSLMKESDGQCFITKNDAGLHQCLRMKNKHKVRQCLLELTLEQ